MKENLTRKSVIGPKISQTSFLSAAENAMNSKIAISSKTMIRDSPDTRILIKRKHKIRKSFKQSMVYILKILDFPNMTPMASSIMIDMLNESSPKRSRFCILIPRHANYIQ